MGSRLLIGLILGLISSPPIRSQYPLDVNTFNNLTDDAFKHLIIDTGEWEANDFVYHIPQQPISFSARAKRQLNSGNVNYVYNTDTDESVGNWMDWSQVDTCSRSCG